MKSFSEFLSEASENKKFFDDIYRRARALGASDIEAKTMAAQGSLETGYGKSPSGSFNYFGQKGTSRENTSRMSTREVVNGRSVRVNADFKNYDSLDASIRDRMKIWGYRTKGAESVEDAARRLQIPYGGKVPGSKRTSHGAYATDPDYVSKVASIARTYGGNSGSPIKGFPKIGTKGYLDTPSSTIVLAKLKGKTGELDKTTGKFSTRGWSNTEGSRYKKYGGK
jgi:flagellum-specific peptidoglycan hydrolase FlgJ